MERQERVWILAWAAIAGSCLLLLHNWILTFPKPGAEFQLIWPLYVMAISVPLTMQMLSKFRTQRLMWGMNAGFTLIMAVTSGYLGRQTWVEGLASYQYAGQLFQDCLTVSICWFVLMPFAEHRLAREHWFNDYALLFSSAWRNAIKLTSAILFVCLFWGLLFLWAGLFKVVKIEFFFDLFTNRSFIYPITALAFGSGLSLYSAKEDALVGIYRASLNVLGWLLPLVAIITLLFLLTLPFQGLKALWETGHATTLMLMLLAAIVFLLNAAWQDYRERIRFPVWMLRLISLAVIAMPVYSALCAYSLGLRVHQYGWSIERIWAALIVFFLAIYSFGYAATCPRKRTVWMDGARHVNVFAALMLTLLLTLTATPLLNPARIAVNSQVERLLTQKVAAGAFDFDYLRFHAGKYGNEKLRELLNVPNHPESPRIHDLAEAELKKQYPYGPNSSDAGLSKDQLEAKLKVHPKTTALDPAFLDYLGHQLKDLKLFLNCSHGDQQCQVWMIDLNGDGSPELILFDSFQSRVFAKIAGEWKVVGTISGPSLNRLTGSYVEGILDAGSANVIPNKWRDFQLGADRYSVVGHVEP